MNGDNNYLLHFLSILSLLEVFFVHLFAQKVKKKSVMPTPKNSTFRMSGRKELIREQASRGSMEILP